MSYEAHNQLRKKSKAKQGLRSPWRGRICASLCKDIGKSIFSLISSGLQVYPRSSVHGAAYACSQPNRSHDNQNSQGCRHQTTPIRSNQQFNTRRDCRTCCSGFSYWRRMPWLITSNKTVRFVWSLSLIVYWQQNLSRSIVLLSQITFVV